MIYILYVHNDTGLRQSAKPPFGGGKEWRVYSKKHYSTKTRTFPITCKVHDLQDDDMTIRLYHYYRGIKSGKKSLKRLQNEPDAPIQSFKLVTPNQGGL